MHFFLPPAKLVVQSDTTTIHERSDGNVQRVIGLDIEYKATRRATLSVWQPEYVGDEGSEELVAGQALVAQVKLHLRSVPR